MKTAMRNSHAQHTDFGFMTGWCPGNPKAMPSNLDMVLERRGKFLVAEWKRPGEKISTGQEILLTELSGKPDFTVLIITGHADGGTPNIGNIYRVYTDKPHCREMVGDVEGLKDFVGRWYKAADTGGSV